jgi:hypothetical protein
VSRMVGKTGIVNASCRGCCFREIAMRMAFFSCSRMRKANVLRSRKVRKQSKGEGVAPAAFCKYLRLSYNARSFFL